jgi:hypothetical protein
VSLFVVNQIVYDLLIYEYFVHMLVILHKQRGLNFFVVKFWPKRCNCRLTQMSICVRLCALLSTVQTEDYFLSLELIMIYFLN